MQGAVSMDTCMQNIMILVTRTIFEPTHKYSLTRIH